MDARAWWSHLVDGVALVWMALFLVDLLDGANVLSLSPPIRLAVETSLRWLLVVFLLDVVLLYRWSDRAPREFVRSEWFLIVTAIPWFRPLRALRAIRGIRALRLLVGVRRTGALVSKLRRTARRVRDAIEND